MNNTGYSIVIRSVLTVGTVLALLVAAYFLVSGLFMLGTGVMLGGFHEGTKGFSIGAQRPSPPTPADLASEARNMAELARLIRQGFTSTGIGGLLLVVSLFAIGRAHGARRPTA